MLRNLFRFVAVLVVCLLMAAPSFAIEIKEVKSKLGVSAWLVEDHCNPIITVNFAWRGGATLDPAGKEGLANLVASTLDEGAGELDSQAFQRALEDLAISLSFESSRDRFSGSLRTLTRNKDRAFELLRLAITNPRFDSDAVERIRGQILSGLRRSSENPNRIAGRELMKAFFPNHPYGRPSRGTLESVPLIKLADLKVFVAERMARDNLVISVVGDISPSELAAVIDATFGPLPAKASPWTLEEASAPDKGRTIVIDKDIPQSLIRFGQPGIKRDDPDFFAAYVMNYVLGGGGFESRLYEEVREKRGLAYSAWSYLLPFNHSALVMGGAGTANARAAETIKIMQGEWKRMADAGLSAQELADAKLHLTGSYALRFSSSRRIAGMLTGIQLEKLGIDYIDKRNGFIQAVTLVDVNRVAKKLLKPDGLTTVVVGRPAGVTSQGQ
jgi:zinc protease